MEYPVPGISVYREIQPFQHLRSVVQGFGIVLNGISIAVDPIELTAQGKLNLEQARAMVAIRGFESEGNVVSAWAGAKIGARIGAPLGPYGAAGGAAIGAMAFGTTSAWLTRKGGNWVLESTGIHSQ